MTNDKPHMTNPKTMPAVQKPAWDEELSESLERELRPNGGFHVKKTAEGGSVPGYEELLRILSSAYKQSSDGKGRDRHAASPVGFRPWHEQPILANARQVGPGGPAQQVMKKVQEAVTMAGNGNFDGAKAEALGAIVYAAALHKLFEEMEAASR